MPTNPDQQLSDERSSYRCATGGERTGRLQVEQREARVEIIDESVNGFGVVVGEDFECEAGQVALLQTDAGWSEVRIVNVRPLESLVLPQALQASGSPGQRLGLLRLRDLPSNDCPPTSWLRVLFARVPRVSPLHSMGGAVGAIVGVVVVGLLMVFALEQLPVLSAPGGARTPADPRKLEPAGLTKAPRAVVELPEISRRPAKPTARAHATTRAAATAPSEMIRALRPQHLFHPDVAPKLDLNLGQLAELRRLARQWETLLHLKQQEASHAASESSAADSGRRVEYEDEAVEYGKRVWSVLTDQQREQWTAHVKASAEGDATESRTSTAEGN